MVTVIPLKDSVNKNGGFTAMLLHSAHCSESGKRRRTFDKL